MSRLPEPQRVAFDWDDAKRRLAEMAGTLDSASRIRHDDNNNILEQRARQLAVSQQEESVTLDTIEVLTFRINDDQYAIETRYVLELTSLATETVVPGCPTFLRGIANLRGEILAVIDLSAFFGLAPASDTNQILVLGQDHAEFGIVINDAADVTAISRSDVSLPAIAIPETQRQFLIGVTPDAILVLNGESLLNDGRLVIDEV